MGPFLVRCDALKVALQAVEVSTLVFDTFATL